MKIIENRSTRILAFVAGEFDMTFATDVTIPLLKDVKSQAPNAVCDVRRPTSASTSSSTRTSPPFNNPQIRKAMALALDRKAFAQILSEGKASIGAAMLPAPERRVGHAAGGPGQAARLRADVEKSQAEARKIMEGLGYGPATAQGEGRHPQYRRSIATRPSS